MIGAVMFFVAGVQLWKFGLIIVSGLIAFPIIWSYVIQDYQKQRILTFLNPESDPLGAGYHITQSKIALGSGGFWGKGLFEGTQSHLNFLPEKQTDFLFAMLGEELGLVGSIILLLLYLTIIVYGYIIAYKSRNNFGKFIAVGLTTNFFLYLAINIAMVTGMMPVVGVPLPLISYGGTVMITLMFSFGLIQNAFIHGDMILSTTGD
jgi:rod shape determining protein RodA